MKFLTYFISTELIDCLFDGDYWDGTLSLFASTDLTDHTTFTFNFETITCDKWIYNEFAVRFGIVRTLIAHGVEYDWMISYKDISFDREDDKTALITFSCDQIEQNVFEYDLRRADGYNHHWKDRDDDYQRYSGPRRFFIMLPPASCISCRAVW